MSERGGRRLITSTSNRTVKLIRSLRNRRERDRQGLFFAEGIRIVAEAAQTGSAIEAILLAPELLTSPFARELADRQAACGVAVYELSAEVFRSVSQREGPQGIGALVRQRWDDLAGLDAADKSLWVALDAVQDPGNLGTILRTTDAVGGGGVLLIGNSADPYDPAAVRASMGSVFGLRLMRADKRAFAAFKAARGVKVVGTSGAAEHHYREVTYPQPIVLLSGSERQGLHPELAALCDDLVRIPMSGRCDSLNLAVATSIVLYEVFAQQEKAQRR